MDNTTIELPDKKQKMTLHRALAELKLIDSKISKGIQGLVPTGIKQNNKKVYGIVDEKEFKETAISDYDSIISLIKRKNKIKCAIVHKNAITVVDISGKPYTIAEAINFKALIAYKKQLLSHLNSHKKKAASDLERNMSIVDQNLQKILEATLGKDNIKSSPDDIENVRKPFLENNEWKLVDPLSIDKKIKDLEEEISGFETEVDAVLSEANAITTIDI